MAQNKASKDKHLDLLESINDKLNKATSFKYAFSHGIVRGLGTAIGATVVAAIIFGFLAQISDAVNIQFITDLVDTTQ